MVAVGGRVMVHENWRWQPWQREMKRSLEPGDVGEPFGYRFTMRNNDGLGKKPYPNQPYFGDVEQVYAVTRRRDKLIAGEDRAVLVLDGVVEGQRYLLPEPAGMAMGSSLIEGETGRLLALANGEVYWNGSLIWRAEETVG